MEEYLKTLVSFHPVSSDQAAVLRLLQYVQKHLDTAGLRTELLTHNGVHSLYASTTSKKHTKLLLQGHVDVVPGGNAFKTTEDSYEGRGTFDMLFAVACYMKLVDDLAGKLDKLDLGIFLSGDEELGGDKGTEAFLEDGYSTDISILPDAGTEYGTLSSGAKGLYELRIQINGKAHHASRPWEGDGAAAKLVHFLHDAEKIFDASMHENTTMTVATLRAGEAMNVGPSTAETVIDIRYTDKADKSRVDAELAKLLQKYDGQITETLHGDDYQIDTSNPLVKQFIGLYEQQIGKKVELQIAHGSSDARFLVSRGIPALMWRPDGGGAHSDNEWVSREGTELFYRLLKDYVLKTAVIGENL